jgi:hypothetical protein
MNQTRCAATLVPTASLMAMLHAHLKTRGLQTSSSMQNLRVSFFACVFSYFFVGVLRFFYLTTHCSCMGAITIL